ncbi:MAG: ATP phosphoribosyltransferase regulatory subunit [Burkholderiaceae bacterium]|jgi:ATP phosphoribosyltransferase regulatory subunit|nr:ATP phosphoribosyltransferase regulatory subunit [Burkholderiaceae bacterium]MEB2319359.1 ATP phosphoribosyltransferase regulatory subunit [Pseudomonadota bacterium]
MPRWLLPESIADVLPSEARRIEELRRSLLDLYRRYGYELVMPPLVEYLSSLLTGAGSTLEIRTAQLVDQSSGRRLGVRADMTPQVARIDAHLLGRQGPSRLCYAGPVLHARPADLFASRVPYQVGAELYGHAGQEAELEIIDLMLASLRAAGLARLRVDLCHAGIVPALLERAPQLEAATIYRMMVQKDVGGLKEVLAGTDPVVSQALLALPSLYGTINGATSVLDRATEVLPDIDGIGRALDDLRRLAASSLWSRLDGVELAVDLADLAGYHYYSGISFAAYSLDTPASVAASAAIARGGRYDGVGEAFGRARPATGFSLELRSLAEMSPAAPASPAIRAPWADDAGLRDAIAALRAQGEVVIEMLPGHEHEEQEFACDRELVRLDGRWTVRSC